MPRPLPHPLRFPPFMGKIRFKRVRNTAQGVLYQNVDPQVGLPLWVRYNIPGKYWEYSIDNVNFFRLKENPYVPDNIYFINRGTEKPTVPPIGDCVEYVRNINGTPKLCALWSDNSEVIIATGPADILLFDPRTIAGISLWLKADTEVFKDTGLTLPAVADGDIVKGWIDQSGFTRNFTEATNGPTLKLNVVNSRSVLRFDGVNDKISSAVAISNFFGAQAGTIFIVYRAISTISNIPGDYQNDNLLADVSGYMGVYLRNSATKQASYGTFDGVQKFVEKAIVLSTWYISSWMHDTTNLYGGLSDTRTASLAAVAAGATSNMTNLLVVGNAFSRPANVDVAEIIIYDNAVSEANRKLVEQYLAAKYAITIPY